MLAGFEGVQKVTHPELKRRLDFIGLDETKIKQLKRAWPAIEKNLPVMLEEFYRRVMSDAGLAKIIGDPSNIERLKNAQRKHWAKLFEGTSINRFMMMSGGSAKPMNGSA